MGSCFEIPNNDWSGEINEPYSNLEANIKNRMEVIEIKGAQKGAKTRNKETNKEKENLQPNMN